MKRRMISILCVLCLVVAMLPPVTASAAAPTTLTVGGTNVLDGGGCWKTNADGTLTTDGASESDYNVKYDKDSNTLTLKDATINGTNTIYHVGAGIFASGDLTIVLEGSSTVTGVQDPNGETQSIRVEGNLTIQGGGSLTAQGAETSSGSSYGIFVFGSFTQQGGSVTAIGGNINGNYTSTGLYVSDGTVTAQDGTLTATGGTTGSGSYGISMFSSVTVNDAIVTATGGTGKYSYGLHIQSSSPSVTISGGGSLTARSESADRAGGIYVRNLLGSAGAVTVGDNSTLLANSVILYDQSYAEKPLAPTGDGSWLIYGQSNQTSAVGGNYTLEENLTIESGNTLTIPAGSTLTVPQGKTLTVNGTLNIANQSSLTGSGTLDGSGAFNLTNPDPVISGSDTLTYDGTDQFNDFSLTAPTGTVTVMGKEFAISDDATTEGWSLVEQEIKNAGTYNLTAKNGTSTIVKEVTVNPATISITSATVQDKTYDGNQDATVTGVEFTGLVNSESLSLGTDYTATAVFGSANAGSQTATVTVTLKGGSNYTFAGNQDEATYDSATGTISPLPVVLEWETTSFTYDGNLKTVTATVNNRVGEDEITLSYTGNTGTAVNSYTATVTSLDNTNYTLDNATGTTQAWSIGGASIAGATVTLSPESFTYDGNSHTPTVTVKLGDKTLTENTDYTVTYDGDTTNAGEVTVTVTGTGNYSGEANQTPSYTINKADQAALTITSTSDATYGQDYTLTTSGGSGSGAVTITVSNGTGAATVSGYTLTPTKAGTVTVTAVKAGDNNYNDGTSVSATITINKGTYDGTTTATGTVLANWPGEVELPGLPDGASYGEPSSNDVTGMSITGGVLHYTGGSGIVKDQTYTVTVPVAGATNYNDYQITVTLTGTDKKVLTITGVTAQNGTYNGQTQAGYTGTPSAQGYTGDFTVTYNTTDGKAPTNAGNYAVTIAIPDSDPQYVGSIVLEFAIAKKPLTVSAPSASVYVGDNAPELALTYTGLVDGESVTPSEAPAFTITKSDDTEIALADAVKTAGTYTITWSNADGTTFTGADNYDITLKNTGTLTVTVRSSGGGGSSSGSGNKTETTTNPDGSTTTTVTSSNGTVTETTKFPDGSKEVVETKKDGTVTTTTTDTAGNKTQVVENTDGSSKTTVDNKDGSGSVTVVDENGQVVSEATLSQSAVAAAQEKGEAVTLPMPEVPVTTDRENAPTVTVDLPSGTSAKVEIPVADVTPGTVAVIVKADGTEEVIKTSLTTENGVAVTLSDGDTVKVVDNSKTFDDVSDNYWGAEAVAFASSRELFAGTSATTFAPDTAMTRAMIVTVLARFEGVDTTTGSTWYEAGQQWAVQNGVSDGTNMDQGLSREQLATMLWRYAGSPSVSNSLSGYTDAGTVSSYAQQAMAWCVEQGIIGGTTTTTLSPQGPATRAQVATILMRYIENIA
ncbi:beta strand repeat-containing protein [Agathobaculum sp. Marseille-P7918]|uniref:beta strand repeat-containing protein n=1 Tax=Agathobaculum sp. Marseille-P7918 TaxID=2479843 RepID=UPI000F6374D7|nr:S-layer homology domain-containing protein [Agathobaculum sp. Marseille-P7918]